MAAGFPYFLSGGADELQQLRRSWGWFLALGVLLTLTGLAAVGYPVAATLVTVEVVGVFLLVAAGVQFVTAVRARRWGGFAPHLLCGLLALFLGVLLVESPGLGAAGYTLMLAVFIVASGLFRVVTAAHRYAGWGWALLSGLVTLLLGVLVWRSFPESALWVIGTFVGIDLAFLGGVVGHVRAGGPEHRRRGRPPDRPWPDQHMTGRPSIVGRGQFTGRVTPRRRTEHPARNAAGPVGAQETADPRPNPDEPGFRGRGRYHNP